MQITHKLSRNSSTNVFIQVHNINLCVHGRQHRRTQAFLKHQDCRLFHSCAVVFTGQNSSHKTNRPRKPLLFYQLIVFLSLLDYCFISQRISSMALSSQLVSFFAQYSALYLPVLFFNEQDVYDSTSDSCFSLHPAVPHPTLSLRMKRGFDLRAGSLAPSISSMNNGKNEPSLPQNSV